MMPPRRQRLAMFVDEQLGSINAHGTLVGPKLIQVLESEPDRLKHDDIRHGFAQKSAFLIVGQRQSAFGKLDPPTKQYSPTQLVRFERRRTTHGHTRHAMVICRTVTTGMG